ncbi:hypothetical protein [Jannaschia aquimarina]|uniref:Uncharacterized protein n=1 Tax=Jannaschia aquimarina TaxID=935700 RepID=A0A0D1EM29_9RHOB|nr:hypothetical protein [Jannaschia aquimarina]KIT18031.1 hypothetical protein jaqu_01560 [Jannaschia aquimarina]SNS88895.1 hypothetical protein SAMN05421775_103181 [Jannaschia aquimarina]
MMRLIVVVASLAVLGAAVNASWRGVGGVSTDVARSVRTGSAGGVGYVRVK